MNEPVTISNNPPELAGMDFLALRQQGIKLIQQLSGNVWTDFNLHDPGITILEQLCYAITDLSYRLTFDMPDLLTHAPTQNQVQSKQFFTAAEILTSQPVTILDYRKLLIDIDGVRNAWLETYPAPFSDLYYDTQYRQLGFDDGQFRKKLNLTGLYRVIIEAEDNIVKDDALKQALKQTVKDKLHAHRNVSEDFAQIEILEQETIMVNTALEIADDADPELILAKAYFAVQHYISPSLRFYSLSERLKAGLMPEAIFNGPLLEHGFIDNQELQSFDRKTALYKSDLIRLLMSIEGVKAVKKLSLEGGGKSVSEQDGWVLKLDINYTPKLYASEDAKNNILLYKKQTELYDSTDPNSDEFNKAKFDVYLAQIKQEATSVQSSDEEKDLAVPQGDYRELNDYLSIQNDFPVNFGLGQTNSTVSSQRKAQVKQLKAYLMLFDQLLSNYFAQLAHVKELLAVAPADDTGRTYFAQPIDGVFQAEDVWVNSDLNELVEGADAFERFSRKDRLMDHLLARFSEDFPDSSLLGYSKTDDPLAEIKQHLADKQNYLRNYAATSSARYTGYNYLSSGPFWGSSNVSGLQRRIAHLLGISDVRNKVLSLSGSEGFHMVEHILLRPVDEARLKRSSRVIDQLTQVDDETLRVESIGHGLISGELITLTWRNISDNFLLTTTAIVISVFSKDTFEIYVMAEDMQAILDANSTDYQYLPMQQIESIQLDDEDPSLLICNTKNDNGLIEGDKIRLSNEEYTGDYAVMEVLTAKQFKIKTHSEEELVGLLLNRPLYWRFIDQFLNLGHEISEVVLGNSGSPSTDNPMKIIIGATDGIVPQVGDEIVVFGNDSKNSFSESKYRVIESEKDRFAVQETSADSLLLEEPLPEGLRWAYVWDMYEPYSCQISFVFPTEPTRFQKPQFKELVKETIARETPAHIGVNLYWFDKQQMNAFEKVYNDWVLRKKNKYATAGNIDTAALRVLQILKLGSPLTEFDPELFGVIGEMIIREDFHLNGTVIRKDFRISYPTIPDLPET